MSDRICDNCMNRVPVGSEKCPECGIRFENTNPGGALPNGWVLGGRYTVGRYIDIDGEGVTYSAIDGDNLQRVTVKEFMPVTLCAARNEDGAIVPKPGCEVLFKTTRMDFADLYASMLRLGHVEGLIQVLDTLEENNTAYAVLEKIEGPTLAEYLTKRETPVEPARALALLRPVLNGVETMHSANLVHRGISPENIVLESGGAARLTGFATLALRQHGSELKAKLYPGYSAPEQYAASEFEGQYTDVYALGCVLYRLTTGLEPDAANERKAQDELKPARALNKEVPAFLSAGIARSMRLVPAERIQNIPDLRLALSGEGGREAKGFLGLTRQQMIVGACALGAVVVLLLVVLLVSTFTRNRADASSSLVPSSSSSSVSVGETIPDLTNKKVEDVLNNRAYTDVFTFAEPQEEYNDTVEAGRIVSQSPQQGTVWDGSTPIQLVVSLGPKPVEIPDFVSNATMLTDADKTLKELGIQYTTASSANTGTAEPGTILKVDVVRGDGNSTLPANQLRPGVDTLVLTVAGEVSTIPMPEITGRTQAEATAELTRQGIQYRILEATNDKGTKAVGTVAYTEPKAGEGVATGATIVNVYVYGKFYMPDLNQFVNQDPAALTAYLETMGIPYDANVVADVEIPSAEQAGLAGFIARIDHTVGAEVTSSTKVVIHVYKPYTPPAPPASTP